MRIKKETKWSLTLRIKLFEKIPISKKLNLAIRTQKSSIVWEKRPTPKTLIRRATPRG